MPVMLSGCSSAAERLEIVPANVKTVVDELLKINTVYEYGVRAMSKNGLSRPAQKS
jgi:hypothetical protein